MKGDLKRWWEKRGWTRDQLAEASGISGNMLSAYNTGQRALGIRNAKRIADALGISLLDLGAPTNAVEPQEAETVTARLAVLEKQTDELQQILNQALRHIGLEPVYSTGQEGPTVRQVPSQPAGNGP